MGLLDSVVGALGAQGGVGGGGAQGQLLPIVMKLVEQAGGLDGLLKKFQQGGLGELVQSWISSGANLPLSGDQLGKALGPDLLKQAGAGQDLLGPLAQLLPQLVDGLTPDGKLPAGGADLGQLGALLGGKDLGQNLGGVLGGLLGKR